MHDSWTTHVHEKVKADGAGSGSTAAHLPRVEHGQPLVTAVQVTATPAAAALVVAVWLERRLVTRLFAAAERPGAAAAVRAGAARVAHDARPAGDPPVVVPAADGRERQRGRGGGGGARERQLGRGLERRCPLLLPDGLELGGSENHRRTRLSYVVVSLPSCDKKNGFLFWKLHLTITFIEFQILFWIKIS